MIEMKTCTKCKNEKPLSAFNKHRHSQDGHAWQCRECNATRAKTWRRTPTGIYANLSGRVNYYKKHGTRQYRPLEITKEDFIKWYENEPKVCSYCEIPEEKIPLVDISFDDRVTHLVIDRKDNDLGYSAENMVLACHLCNFIKMNRFSFNEMRMIAQTFIKPKWKEFIER